MKRIAILGRSRDLPYPQAHPGTLCGIVAVTPDAPPRIEGAYGCRILLAPARAWPALEGHIAAEQIISYGFSPRDTLTLSSVAQALLCVQRQVIRLDGARLEPQEIALNEAARVDEWTLLRVGLRLLAGE